MTDHAGCGYNCFTSSLVIKSYHKNTRTGRARGRRLLEPKVTKQEYKKGMLAAIGCPAIWGLLPIYWQALRPINSWAIILYRVFLVFVVSFIAAKKCYSWERIIGPMKDKREMLKYLAAGAVITLDWSVYIWAVNSDKVIQTCIGNYMEPLMVCVFGLIFFKEKLTKYKTVSFSLALLSVVIIILHFHEIPSIAIVLAITFAVYSAIKKTVKQPPLISLTYETMFLALPALALIIYLEVTGQGALGNGAPYQCVLILFAGLLSVIPLALFAMAAKKVSLLALGLTEYICPTLSLFLGIFVFKEPFDIVQLIAFAFIWVGLVYFTYGEVKTIHAME